MALELPAGEGRGLTEAMDQFIEDLLIGLPAAFESQEYRAQITDIIEQIEEQQEAEFTALKEKASKEDISLVRTPSGYTPVPLANGKPLDTKAFKKISATRREKYEQSIDTLKEELKEIILKLPAVRKEGMAQIKALNQSYTESTVAQFISSLLERYAQLQQVIDYLQTVQQDIIDHFEAFLPGSEQPGALVASDPLNRPPELQIYKINLLVDQTHASGAPVIYEDNPSYNNLI